MYKNPSDFVAINARLAKVWATIIKRKDPLPDADDDTHSPSTRELLIEE